MTTRRPKGETMAEHFARMTDRIAQLETQIRDLMDENAELRQQIDLVTEREREGRELD
jgi:predicted  nucleic acid-binding Zn-ribbon protein